MRPVAHEAGCVPALHYNAAFDFDQSKSNLERWQSGRMYLTRNQAYGNPVPWVRIPPSPPIPHEISVKPGSHPPALPAPGRLVAAAQILGVALHAR